MVTGSQFRASRALVELSREKIAARSGVDVDTILQFERQVNTPPPDVIAKLKETLEEAGAVFIPEGKRGIGVQLKFTASETRRIATLENEGGIAASDDVP